VQLHELISRIRGESKTVGLDIGHRLIRMAVVSHRQNSDPALVALEYEVLPDGVVVDNEVRNLQVLMDKIQILIARAMPGGAEGDFVMAVNWTSGVLCDKIVAKPVPKVPEHELILQTAMGRSPFDDAGNVLDFSVLDRRDDGVEAMIVAAKKESLMSWTNLFHALNIKLFAIDVDAFVLSNAYFAAKAPQTDADSLPDDDDSALILNLGFSKSYAALLQGGHFNTARSILGCSVRDLQEQLAGPLNIVADRCGELLMGLSAKEIGLDESKVKSAVEYIFEEVALKVDNALRYFSSSDNYRKPAKIVITGGGSNIVGLLAFLANRLSMEAVRLNPFKSVEIDSRRFHGKDWDTEAGIYTVALGLALRRF